MLRSLFAYDLPESLIARYPAAQRTGSRLLQLDGTTGVIQHSQFTDLPSCLRKGDLLVFNNTRVLPARLLGEKATGGKVEVLIERVVDAHSAVAHIRASKAPTSGAPLFMHGHAVNGSVQRHELRVEGRQHDLFRVRTVGNASILTLMQDAGHMPLPPYIDRADEVMDRERYQTVYAQNPGAVAAPTAGLHFDQPMLDALHANGIDTAFVTLHVGAGTFQPVRAENILEHNMHREWMQVDAGVCAQVAATRARGGRVIAVGTTAVRCLESASASGELLPFNGDTAIFIYPGYTFRTVDALLTNFHLSESSLLMLVCAFAGYQHTMAAYRSAIEQQYRFFSYGDAMFVTHNVAAPQEVLV